MKSYKDLEVWQKSISLVKEIYILTKLLPREEIYGLVSQMRRAAVSIPSNIAEGQPKVSGKEFLRFLEIAYGSLAELETQLIICKELGFLSSVQTKTVDGKIAELGRMINGLSGAIAKSTGLKLVSSKKLTTDN